MQLMTDMLGGESRARRSASSATPWCDPGRRRPLFDADSGTLRVWASHGDFVAAAPPGFEVAATT